MRRTPVCHSRMSRLINVRVGVWPGVRRAGLLKAEPGADAGPAAP